MSYGIKKAKARVRDRKRNGSPVYAVESVYPGAIGVWNGQRIGRAGTYGPPVKFSRNYSYPIGGGRMAPTCRTWGQNIGPEGASHSLHCLGATPSEQNKSAFGALADMERESAALAPESTSPVTDAPSAGVISTLTDAELVEKLNNSIAEGWRLKGCNGPYCVVQATRNYEARSALYEEYQLRRTERDMPPLREPVHTLSYGRYKLARSVVNWADRAFAGKAFWPARIYVKSAAYAMEDVVGSQYLTMFIVTSPLLGIWLTRKIWGGGPWTVVVGAYLGMLAGALLPLGLYRVGRFIENREEGADQTWAVS